MEMKENNNIELPVTEAPVQSFGNTQPHVSIDTGSGLSSNADSVFGYDVSEDDAMGEHSPSDINTLPFTQMESAMVTPPFTAGAGSIIPDGTAQVLPSTATVDFINNNFFARRQARPTFIMRGTNVLIPFGATTFIKEMGAATITNLTAIPALAAAMNALVPNMNTPGSYREVANWRRIFDLKNTVISYYNRSIPFTDLEPEHRFAIEMCYSRDIAVCALPIFAKKYALDLVTHWQKAGFQFDVSKLTNLNSLSAELLNKQIFAAIADLPCLDDVLMSRLGAMTRVRLTAKKSGFVPTVLLQDVTIGGPGRYRLHSQSANSGYYVTTDMSAITGKSALNGTTFAEWVEMWLRSDLCSESILKETLNEFLKLAQSIRTNYSILLACAQQLELKGSIKYSGINEFLPVSGVEEFKLSYKLSAPTFSYSYKERFEYAPRAVLGEVSGGGVIAGIWKLGSLPAYDTTDYSSRISFHRPVGLYKGQSCWGTKEIAEIGIFRTATSFTVGNYKYPIRALIADILGVTITDTNIGTASAQAVDAYYGDYYAGDISHVQIVSNATTGSIACYNTPSEVIQYYGVGNSQCPAFATLDAYISDGGSATAPLTLANGTQVLDLSQYDLSDTESPALLLIPQLIQILEQLDITLYIGNPKNATGRICTPVILFTNYRGCEFDDFDLAPLDNAYSASYQKLSLGMKSKTSGQDRV